MRPEPGWLPYTAKGEEKETREGKVVELDSTDELNDDHDI